MSKKKQKSIVTLLLDRSWSMNLIKDQTVEAVNSWICELRKAKGDMRVTLVQFDAVSEADKLAASVPAHAGFPAGLILGSAVGRGALSMHQPAQMCLEKTIDMKPLSDIGPLGRDDFIPRGMTPLIDAAVATIRTIEEAVAGRDDIKVILAIQTDGDENASVSNTWESLRALVAEKEALGWEILFMGAGIDAYKQAHLMGVARDKTLSYNNDSAATRSAFASTAMNSVLFASGATRSMAYSDAEKRAAGDIAI